MKPEDLRLLRDLLVGQRVLALGVVVEGEPVVGLLPFVVAPDFAALVVHASRLARHSQGLRPGAGFGAVVHTPDAPGADPLQLPRVTLEGRVASPAAGEAGMEAITSVYLAKFPGAAVTVGLGDFAFHRLEIESGRLVAGFGRALNLSRSTLRDLASLR